MTQLIGQCIEQYIAIAQQFDIFIGLGEISGQHLSLILTKQKKTFVMTKWLLQCVSHAPEQSMGQDYTILIRMVIKHIILRVFIYLIHSFYFIKELLPHVSSTITLHNLFFLESHSRFVAINTQKLSLVHQLFS